MRRYISEMAYAMGVVLVMCAAACSSSSNNDDDPDDPNPIPVEPVNEVLSPEDAKEYLDTTAQVFLNKFKPEDQKALVTLSQDFMEEYGEVELPEEWIGTEDDEEDVGPNAVMSHLNAALGRGNIYQLASVVDVFDLARFSGIYEPEKGQWVKKSDSKDVVFKFKHSGNNCEIKAVGEGTETKYTYTDEESSVEVRVPAKTTLTLTEGKTQHVNISVQQNVDENGHKFTVAIKGTVANIDIAVNIEGMDSEVKMSKFIIGVSGEQLISATATAKGYNLCNRSAYEKFYDQGWNDVTFWNQFFTKGTATTDMLGRVQLKGDVEKLGELVKVGTYFDKWDYGSEDGAKKAAEEAVSTYENNVHADIFYGGTDKKQATLVWKAQLGDDYYYKEWSVVPLMKFESDGTTYAFEDYFNHKFASVEDLWASLLESYKKLWR